MGHDFMAHLNGSLNDSMNAFFDNGFNEDVHGCPHIRRQLWGRHAGHT